MDFAALPDPGSPEMVELLCLLDQSRYENARAWVVVVVDAESADIVQCYGPFEQAEQALVEAGEQAAWWKENAPELSESLYKIVPLWGPGE